MSIMADIGDGCDVMVKVDGKDNFVTSYGDELAVDGGKAADTEVGDGWDLRLLTVTTADDNVEPSTDD